MKDKISIISKIIVSAIFITLILLILGNSVKAKVDGYYTHSDVRLVVGNYIEVNGKKYYCRNHGWAFSNSLLREPISNPATKSWGWMAPSAFDNALREFKKTNNEKIGSNNKVLSLKFKSREKVTDPLEAAFYAFADYYCENPSEYVQSSLWYFLNKHPEFIPGESSNAGSDTTLCEAAEYYANEWLPDKADLKINYKDAKVRIIGKDYIVGPITIKYKEKEFDVQNNKIVFSELLGHMFKDQNGGSISASITNAEGAGLSNKLPNGIPFYVKFPYSDTISQLNIEDKLKYIDDVEAYKEDVETTPYSVKYVWTDKSQTRDIYRTEYTHASGCPNGGGSSSGSSCPNCSVQSHQVYDRTEKSGSTTGRLKFTRISALYQNLRMFDGTVKFKEEPIKITIPINPPGAKVDEMDLAGYVWEDMPEGKDQKVNGIKDGNDKALAGIEVRLYDITSGKLAKVYKSSNPTLTDANGHYEFIGLDATHKYYVEFTYDGILYTNTYGGGVPEYNTPAWNATSKGSELVSGRNDLNDRFKTISSHPAAYKVPTAIFGDPSTYLAKVGSNYYNRIYSITDIQNGTGIVAEYKNKIISQLRNYLGSNGRLEDGDQNYFDNVYWPIIRNSSNQTEAKQVLQYIWDCRIKAVAGDESERDGTTKQPKVGLKVYPVYDKFALTDEKGNRITANNSTAQYNGYRIIYNGQLHINLGLIKRPTTDLELTKDLYRAVVSINGQDETYNFGTFDKKGLKINASDAQIKQEVATADYNYADYARDRIAGTSGILPEGGEAAYPENYAPIEMYITYRINVKNNSSIPTSVNEIVSYIDTNYYSYSNTYKTTGGKALTGITGTYLYPSKDENGVITERTEEPLSNYSKSNFGLKVNEHSKYGTESETGGNLGIGKELFISFDNDIILENNQMIALYITYRLGENSTSHSKFNCTYSSDRGNHANVILQDALAKGDESKKLIIYTRAEINAYSTFFRKSADPEGTQNKYNYPYTSAVNPGQLYRAAGVFDSVSMPGNLDAEQLKIFNEQDNKKTEDDWDRASAFVIVDPNATRTVKGNVWETVNRPANYWLDNKNAYPKYENQNGAGDITAELVEIKDEIEYVRARTKTNSDGSYSFTEYIPGQYVVRFIYGDDSEYDTKQHSPYTTFELNGYKYKCAYNGQFYQSGKANPNTNINDDNHKNNNQYWYANDTGERYSDAYDEVNRRMEVNKLLNTPPDSDTYKFSDVIDVIKHPTDYMVYAYTSLLDVEIEYAKEETTAQNPAYTIENIDFALTPRTESKLEINKEVTHLKLILQNGTVQFDADTKDIREQKVPAVVQAAQGHDINISMSSELVNGATLEISYTITIKNVSPKDTITYYKDTSGKIIALGFYEEDPTKIVYYENDIRTYDNTNRGALLFSRPAQSNGVRSTWTSMITSGKTAMAKLDTTKSITEETTTKPATIADYISNNLNFTKQSYTGAVINEAWDLVTMPKEDFDTLYYKQKQEDVEKKLPPIVGASSEDAEQRRQNPLELDASEVYDSNTIVISNAKNKLIKDLKSGESVSEEIVLSKVISVNDNSTDKKSYNNNVRIVEINNKVSKVQDMGAENLKFKSARVIVSDPTGIGNAYLGIILALVVTVVIGSGIILIKKFVIKK